MTGAGFYLWVSEALDGIAKTPGVPDPLLAWVLLRPELARRGLWLEFGVYQGASLRRIVDGGRGAPRVVGFDSFEGLPEEWRWNHLQVMAKGHFAVDKPPEVPGAELVAGWFAETLPGFLERTPDEPVTLLHVDSDLYSSARCVLRALRPRLHPGAIVVFDELVGYPAFRDGELRALWEAQEEDGLRFEWLAHQEGAQQVAITVTEAR